MHVSLDPVTTAMRQERYVYIKDMFVWNIPLTHDQISSLVCIFHFSKMLINYLLQFIEVLAGTLISILMLWKRGRSTL